MSREGRTADFDGVDFLLRVCVDGEHRREFYKAKPEHLELRIGEMDPDERVQAILALYASGELGEPYMVVP